jgi:uncharacterized damage-inducible protein DinB
MIDDFLARWRHVRGMTTEFLATASDDCLDAWLDPGFVTIREQAGHLAEVQGIYQLALRGEPVDWDRKPEFSPADDSREAIAAALAERDRELEVLLDGLRPDAGAFRIDWYGTELGLTGYGAVFIQHESIHHGQWAAYAALGGYRRPDGWLLNWGL